MMKIFKNFARTYKNPFLGQFVNEKLNFHGLVPSLKASSFVVESRSSARSVGWKNWVFAPSTKRHSNSAELRRLPACLALVRWSTEKKPRGNLSVHVLRATKKQHREWSIAACLKGETIMKKWSVTHIQNENLDRIVAILCDMPLRISLCSAISSR